MSSPKWCQNGARWTPKSVPKRVLVEKAGVRFDVGKQVVSEGSVGFESSIFETPSDQTAMKKRPSISISISDGICPLLAPFWLLFGSPKSTLGVPFGCFLGYEK